MEYTITGKSPDQLKEILAKKQKLTAERAEFTARLEKVEREKDSVNDRIYEKVRTEYTGKLENIRTVLEPIESEIRDLKKESKAELFDLEEQIRLLEEELAEAEFRNRVGEYDDSKLRDVRSRLHPELADKSDRRRDLNDLLDTIAKSDDGEPWTDGAKTAETAETPEAAEENSEPENFQEISPETESVNEKEKTQEPSFENPQDWIDELGEECKKPAEAEKTPAVDAAVEQPETDDPLSALADPSDERRENVVSKENKKQEEPVCMGFPNLVIVTGHSSGKKIPLLPMTMSIGREHDNNIELKDPEVARYHARIMYERGHFVLEDMDSNNSTWLNGETTKRASLKNGDRIKIGETEMVIDFD
jgi:hypothetical protein